MNRNCLTCGEPYLNGRKMCRCVEVSPQWVHLANTCDKWRKFAIELAGELYTANQQIDGLLKHCKEGECSRCGVIICPLDEPLHFHHDGCPACYEFSDEEYNKKRAKELRREIAGMLGKYPQIWSEEETRAMLKLIEATHIEE